MMMLSKYLSLLAIVGVTSLQAQKYSSTAAMGTMSAASTSSINRSGSSSANMPRVFTPTLPRATYTKYPWKTDITATVFWVGETPTANNPTPNHKSSWDTQWMNNFGGFDNPDANQRYGAPHFRPKNFVPRLNPFYVALPYNDVLDHRTTKPSALKKIPWLRQQFERHGKSVCKDRWIAIRVGNRTCYAQWSDCGPFLTDDVDYVFGNARPANDKNQGAGIDVSPAVRDYLGMTGRSKCDWRFVDVSEVPDGPWRRMGENNHFVKNQGRSSQGTDKAMVASRLEELRRQRDEYHRKYGNDRVRYR